MKRSSVIAASLLCLVALFTYAVPAQMQQQSFAATVEVSQLRSRPTTLTFGPRELGQLEANPHSVLRRFDPATQKDCAYTNRISSCIWACRNGRKIRTCHPQLVRALERVWPK